MFMTPCCQLCDVLCNLLPIRPKVNLTILLVYWKVSVLISHRSQWGPSAVDSAPGLRLRAYAWRPVLWGQGGLPQLNPWSRSEFLIKTVCQQSCGFVMNRKKRKIKKEKKEGRKEGREEGREGKKKGWREGKRKKKRNKEYCWVFDGLDAGFCKTIQYFTYKPTGPFQEPSYS